MLGLINDCTEQLVITKFGLDAWHAIKEAAGCQVKDHGFEQHGHYPDSATVDIVVAAADALGVTVDDVLELFGQYFLEYTINKGYDNLLRCQGSTLRLWLSNLNALHDHLQSSLPAGNFPVFWCENCVDHEGTIVLHYYSVRGALLGSVVVGIVKEVAKTYFEIEVELDKIAVQGEDGSECTTWRISAVDPTKAHKLTQQDSSDPDAVIVQKSIERRATLRKDNRRRSLNSALGSATTCSGTSGFGPDSIGSISNGACPFAGAAEAMSMHSSMFNLPTEGLKRADSSNSDLDEEKKDENKVVKRKMLARRASSQSLRRLSSSGNVTAQSAKTCPCPHGSSSPGIERRKSGGGAVSSSLTNGSSSNAGPPTEFELGLPSAKVCSIFPYHVMVNVDFKIVQIGRALPEMLMRDTDDLVGRPIDKVLKITKPILAGWDWPTLHRLADQKFFLAPVAFEDTKTGARIEHTDIKFKGNMITISRERAMFVLSPDAENILELSQMGLTMSDLPLHSFQRDVVFLGEHIASEVRTAHKLDRLSKRLEREKNLSNTLLNSMLPAEVAEKMRAGKTVEPLLYENVTLFFSDVVGFTSICDAVEPWDVIDMLNQLYTVMDHLASHFKLYKVETIGDAYMCCSGMPTPDENHAQNIANFAVAVSECVHLVKSPADGEPLQLRIGIHTGHCMGGVVGTLTPHYCLFGDMVNTTARHESTGMNGKIQCSSVLYEHLAEYSSDSKGPMYDFTARGYVDMKGKGRCYTYWLDGGSKHNELACPSAITELQKEVGEALSKKKWKKRKYFDFRRRRSSTIGYDGDNGDAMTVGTGATSFVDDGTLGTADRSSMPDDIKSGLEQSERSASGLDSVDAIDAASTIVSSVADGLVSAGDELLDVSDHDTVSFIQLKKTPWSDIKWDPGLSRIDLVAAVHGLMSSLLWKCTVTVSSKLPSNKEVLDHELLRFVDRISSLYDDHPFHSWEHACQVVLSATYLIKEYHQTNADTGGPVDSNPFTRFITVFAALIHDVKHLGVPNVQLAKENHSLTQVYRKGSYQERQSIQIALGIFVEEFPELSTEILKMCPVFLHLVTSAVLATDVASSEIQGKIQERFERVLLVGDNDVTDLDRTQAVIEQMLLLADVGHCSQAYDNFLNWNAAFFHECVKDYQEGRGNDPRPGWHDGQITFLEGYILPLTERCNALLPQCELTKGTRRILRMWKKDGKEWTDKLVEQSVKAEKAEKQRKTPTGSQSQAREAPTEKKVKLRRFSLFKKNPFRKKSSSSENEESAPIKSINISNGGGHGDRRESFYDEDLEGW